MTPPPQPMWEVIVAMTDTYRRIREHGEDWKPMAHIHCGQPFVVMLPITEPEAHLDNLIQILSHVPITGLTIALAALGSAGTNGISPRIDPAADPLLVFIHYDPIGTYTIAMPHQVGDGGEIIWGDPLPLLTPKLAPWLRDLARPIFDGDAETWPPTAVGNAIIATGYVVAFL